MAHSLTLEKILWSLKAYSGITYRSWPIPRSKGWKFHYLVSILAYKGYSSHNLASTPIDFHSFSFFTLTRFLGVPIITPNHSFRNKSSKLGVHFLLTAYSSSIYFSYKISMGYQITSSFHDNLQSDTYRFLVHLITFSKIIQANILECSLTKLQLT